MVKAIIFDIDGTLIDSVDLHAQAWQEAFRKFGREIPYEQIRHQIGKGGDQLMPVFLSQEELDSFSKELEEYRGDLFKREYLPKVRGFSQVRELFERILGDGKRIVLASSANGDELAAYKKIAQIEDLIEDETSRDDAEKSKPYPDIFAAALKKLRDIPPEDALVIGDTPYDVQAANQLGLRTVGVLCGGFPESELRANGCIAIFADPADLLSRYEESPLAQAAVNTAG